MAKRKQQEKGIKLIHIIIIILIIIIAVLVSKRFSKNGEDVEENSQEQGQILENEKYVKIFEDGVKMNTSAKLNEDKEFEDLKIRDIQLTYRNGVTNLLCNVENTSNKKVDLQEVVITLLDENGDVIYKMKGIIDEINPGETKQFNSSVTADFSNAYDFEITK